MSKDWLYRKKGMNLSQPAIRWKDALPCGNGRLGALVYGNIRNDLIVLNHEALWLEKPSPEIRAMDRYLPEYRRLLLEGKYQKAAQFFEDKFSNSYLGFGIPDPYQPAFDIQVDTYTTTASRDYCRFLDFETGEAIVKWSEDNAFYDRRLFVSRADDAIVMRIRASIAKSINCGISLIPHNSKSDSAMGSGRGLSAENIPFIYQTFAEDSELVFRAKYENGKEFGGIARVVAERGIVRCNERTLEIEGADQVLLIAKLFVDEQSKTALKDLRVELDRMLPTYEHLLTRHVRLHSELFNRVELSLVEKEESSLTNEELLLKGYGGQVPTELVEKMFDYGRYLLISSSGEMPANLQGVWNGDYVPAWSADYHNDENIQMNYWPALPGNLAETTLPYFDYYESMLDDYRVNARCVYGCRGILAPIAQSTHGLVYGTSIWSAWTAGAGWLAQLFYDYWLFTGDRAFLQDRAIPFLKEVALFYEDFLIENDEGEFVFVPSLSPENIPSIPDASFVTINATMDVAVAREVFTNLCNACRILEIHEEDLEKWEAFLSKLPQYEVNDDGAIKEWIHADLEDNYYHRHLSHIYPAFPGFEITEEKSPELFDAIRVAVEKRLVIGLASQTGWSLAHMANIYARLGEGNRALECLELLCRSCVGPNLFTYHNDWRSQGITMFCGHGSEPLFQIDANFGFTAAILEMLVFSEPGMIKLLPALPDKWRKGSVDGIMCRGSVRISIEWDSREKIVAARLWSKEEQEIILKFPCVPISIDCDDCGLSSSPIGPQYRTVLLPSDREVSLSIRYD